MDFKLASDYTPTGDQPEAISKIVKVINDGEKYATLHGVTGSGKTFTMANIISQLNRPTLILSHNKTLAAQLYGEFKNFFPENAVEYFVSYYDYFQPEAYLPTTDTYIEKDLSINQEIERMRLKTVSSLLSGRRDVIVVSSVSCIYGCGNPDDFHSTSVKINVGQRYKRNVLLRMFVDALYSRVEHELRPATFRVTGDTIDIMAAFGEFGNQSFRIMFFDDEVEAIYSIDHTTGQKLASLDSLTLYPTNLFVTTQDRINRAVSEIYLDLGKQIEFFHREGHEDYATRLKQRVEFDVEMIKELGYCQGIENYSRYFDGREAGTRPFCLMDFFPSDFITIIDESHVTIPQVRGMYGGDRARKETLVDYGFRLPAAKDNRPLQFDEFMKLTNTSIYVSATPAEFERKMCDGTIIEQMIRPTLLIDPPLFLTSSENMIDRLIEEIDVYTRRGDKVLVTTLTKRSAEEVSRYFDRIGIRNMYLHSDIETMERVEILDRLRQDEIDVIVGVNLLREGLDLPEVALVAILDADADGFLRNVRSLTQMSGRAARHTKGHAMLFCNRITDSIYNAVAESNRRREKQIKYNFEHQQFPRQAQKSGSGPSALLNERESSKPANMTVYPIVEEHYAVAAEPQSEYSTEDIETQIKQAREDMERAAKSLDFLAAARYRDRMRELEKLRSTAKN